MSACQSMEGESSTGRTNVLTSSLVGLLMSAERHALVSQKGSGILVNETEFFEISNHPLSMLMRFFLPLFGHASRPKILASAPSAVPFLVRAEPHKRLE